MPGMRMACLTPLAWRGYKPASPPGPGPPSGASLDGQHVGHIGWGGPSTGPTPLLLQWCLCVGVSRCGPAAVVGRGCKVFRRGKLIIIFRGEVTAPQACVTL